MGRDTFHCPRLLQAPVSNLDTSRDPGTATAALGTLCQGLPTLTGRNFFLTSHLTLTSASLVFSSRKTSNYALTPIVSEVNELKRGNWGLISQLAPAAQSSQEVADPLGRVTKQLLVTQALVWGGNVTLSQVSPGSKAEPAHG